jgi:predicted ArsR family transcriptional regulator
MARIGRAGTTVGDSLPGAVAAVTAKSHLFQSGRRRIVETLQKEMMTADELAVALDQTTPAIRAQLRSMERDGVVETAGFRPGTTRPFAVYRLTAQVEQLLSHAYLPFLTRVVQVLASRHGPDEFETVMRETGQGLAEDLNVRVDRGRSLDERVTAASQLMNDELGAVTHVEKDSDGLAIKGGVCPLSALIDQDPRACLAIESLLAACVGAPVTECCDRQERPRCGASIVPTELLPNQKSNCALIRA